MSPARARLWLSGAGFFAGPIAWALHQQLGYMLVPVGCQNRLMLVPAVTLLAVVIAAAGGYFSWLPWRRNTNPDDASNANRAHRFVAQLSVLSALLFAFAILLQGAATLFLNGCQR